MSDYRHIFMPMPNKNLEKHLIKLLVSKMLISETQLQSFQNLPKFNKLIFQNLSQNQNIKIKPLSCVLRHSPKTSFSINSKRADTVAEFISG